VRTQGRRTAKSIYKLVYIMPCGAADQSRILEYHWREIRYCKTCIEGQPNVLIWTLGIIFAKEIDFVDIFLIFRIPKRKN